MPRFVLTGDVMPVTSLIMLIMSRGGAGAGVADARRRDRARPLRLLLPHGARAHPVRGAPPSASLGWMLRTMGRAAGAAPRGSSWARAAGRCRRTCGRRWFTRRPSSRSTPPRHSTTPPSCSRSRSCYSTNSTSAPSTSSSPGQRPPDPNLASCKWEIRRVERKHEQRRFYPQVVHPDRLHPAAPPAAGGSPHPLPAALLGCTGF